jgi:histone deacetylase 1/2
MDLFSAPCPVVSCDNQGAIHLMDNNHVKKSNKHINIIYHWSREQIQMNLLRFQYIPTLENPADIFTKSLPGPAFRKFRDMLGLVDRKALSLP